MAKDYIVSPSLLATDPLYFGRDVKMLEEAGAKWFHVDCMDGNFVPNFSFGYSTVSALRKFTDRVLDVHLMIDRPIRYVEHYIKAGADYLTIHVEADSEENTLKALELIKSKGVKCGISIKPKTPVSAIEKYLPILDLVLVMTVEPGFGGQSFMQDMMPKLNELKTAVDKINPACHIQVDGGIDVNTAKICKENGANVFVAGSACLKAEDKKAFINSIEQ